MGMVMVIEIDLSDELTDLFDCWYIVFSITIPLNDATKNNNMYNFERYSLDGLLSWLSKIQVDHLNWWGEHPLILSYLKMENVLQLDKNA